jgi:uncharacterized protein (DUF486 family)
VHTSDRAVAAQVGRQFGAGTPLACQPFVARILVPIMIAASGLFMAFAWLGHLRFRPSSFGSALLFSWMIVLPEYMLNVSATRLGHRIYTGAQMGAVHLASGVVCVALVSRFILNERLQPTQLCGLALLTIAMVMVLHRG